MNLNDLAKEVTLSEGKKIAISIAQVKEVMKILLTRLAKEEPEAVLKLLKKYSK